MKFIYISPFKSQNITNFTFWKIILLEIHEVHLAQEGKPSSLGGQGDGHALTSSLKGRFCQTALWTSPKTISTQSFGWTFSRNYREELDLNIWVLPSNSTSEKHISPNGPRLEDSSAWPKTLHHLQPRPLPRNIPVFKRCCTWKKQILIHLPVDYRFCFSHR